MLCAHVPCENCDEKVLSQKWKELKKKLEEKYAVVVNVIDGRRNIEIYGWRKHVIVVVNVVDGWVAGYERKVDTGSSGWHVSVQPGRSGVDGWIIPGSTRV